jgi:hypothetical protein
LLKNIHSYPPYLEAFSSTHKPEHAPCSGDGIHLTWLYKTLPMTMIQSEEFPTEYSAEIKNVTRRESTELIKGCNKFTKVRSFTFISLFFLSLHALPEA